MDDMAQIDDNGHHYGNNGDPYSVIETQECFGVTTSSMGWIIPKFRILASFPTGCIQPNSYDPDAETNNSSKSTCNKSQN